MRKLIWKTPEDRTFYKKVFLLVLPMAVQNLINVGVTATDVLMLGKVGETVLSGASLAGQVQWLMTLIFFGIASGASVLTAQYWGKRDIAAVEKVLAISIRISVCVSIVFFVLAMAAPGWIMGLFTHERQVIDEGVKYLRIVALSYVATGFTVSYLSVIRSVERVIISTVVYSISLAANIVLNYMFIFGKFGAPRLLIRGAAIGTLCARLIELLIVAAYALWINRDVRIRLRYLFRREKVLMKDFLYYALPVILNEMMWGAGYSANAAIIGRLGSSVVAANSVAHVARQLSMVVAFGVSNAAAIMIGKAIGERREELAENYAGKFVWLAFFTGVAGGALVLLARPLIVRLMGLTGDTVAYMNFFLFVMSYYVVGQSLNSAWVVGIFRSGGDTRFGLALDILTMWGGSILLGAVAAFVLKLPVRWVFVVLMSDEIIKLPFCFGRYRGKKWLRNVTREIPS